MIDGRSIAIARAPLIAFAAMGVLWGTYAALIPDIKGALGASDAVFGRLLLATPLSAVLTMLVAPRIAPRFGSHVLPLAALGLALAYVAPGWQTTPLAFALAMLAVGVTNAFLDVTMNARVSTLEADRGLELMNLAHAAYSLAYGVAAVLTGLARGAGWGPGPILTVAALTVAIGAIAAIERGPDINGFAREKGNRTALGLVPVWGGLMVLIAFMAENAAENWSALHIERTLGAARGEGSFGPAVLALTMGAGRLAGQSVITRLGPKPLIGSGTLVAAGGLTLLSLAPTPGVAYAGLIITGLGSAVLAPTIFALVGRLAAPERRAGAIARATAIGYMGFFFGPPALGLLSELMGLRAAFMAMAALVLALIALMPRLMAAGSRS